MATKPRKGKHGETAGGHLARLPFSLRERLSCMVYKMQLFTCMTSYCSACFHTVVGLVGQVLLTPFTDLQVLRTEKRSVTCS